MGDGSVSALISGLAAGSAAAKAVKSAFRQARWYARYSSIWDFFSRGERTSTFFYYSSLGKAAAAVPNALTRTLKRSGVYIYRKLENTLFYWLLSWLSERYDVFFLLFAAAHALVPFALYRNPYTVAVMIFMSFCACARVALSRGQSTVFSLKRTDPVFLLYFLSIAASAVYSMFGAGSGAASLTTSTLYLTAILFAFLIANTFFDHRRLLILIRVVTGAAVFVALYGIYQYIQGIPIDVTQTDRTTGGASLAMGRADSTLGNPNVLAAWLLLVIPFSVSLAFFAKNWLRKLFMASLSLVLVACILLTQSRSGWVGLFVAGVVFVFFLDWRLIPICAVAGVLSMPFWPNFIMDRLLISGTDTSTVYRMSIYAGSLRMATSNWATGIGIGLEYFKRYINNYVYFAYETAPVHSHNLYLQIWLESGIVAMLAFVWMLLRLIKKGASYIFAQKRLNSTVRARLSGRGGGVAGVGMASRGSASAGREGSAASADSAGRAGSAAVAGAADAKGRTGQTGGAAYETRLILIACISAVLGFLAMGFFEYVWFFPRCMNHFFMIIGIFFCTVNLSAQNQQQNA